MENYSRFPFETGTDGESDFKNPRRKRRTAEQVARLATGADSGREAREKRAEQPAAGQESASDLLAKMMAANTRAQQEASAVAAPQTPEQTQLSEEELARQRALAEQNPSITHPAAERPESSPIRDLNPQSGRGEEFVLHLNDIPGEAPTGEQFIPLREEDDHEAARHTATARPAPKRTPRIPVPDPVRAEQHPQPRAPRAEQPPVPPAATTGEGVVPPAPPEYNPPAEVSRLYPEIPPPPEESSEQRWMSHMPPEMVAASAAYETPPSLDTYADATRAGVVTGSRFASGNGEQLATRREVRRAVQEANQQGVSRGLLTGILAGGLYEHYKHRRREKHQKKQLYQRGKQLEQARTEYRFAAAEQAQKQSETERQLRTVQNQLRERPTPMGQGAERAAAAPPAIQYGESARPVAYGPERSIVPTPENSVPTLPVRQQLPPAEQAQLSPDGRFEIPPDHRLNTDGSYITELDKNGNVVDKPSFEYGHEYYRERAKEAAPASQRIAATGEVALVAAAMDRTAKTKAEHDQAAAAKSAHAGGPAGGGGSASTAGATNVPSATAQGAPAAVHQTLSATMNAKRGGPESSSQSDKPLWPWLVALGVVVAALVALL